MAKLWQARQSCSMADGHIRDFTDIFCFKKKNMKKNCLFVILSYYCWYTTKVVDKISDKKCFFDKKYCQLYTTVTGALFR